MAVWRASWGVEEENFADSFNVYVREQGAAWRSVGNTPGFEFDVEVSELHEHLDVAVAGVLNGVEEYEDAWTIIPFAPGAVTDFDPPADVEFLSAAQVDNTFDVRFAWAAVVDPNLDGYEIRQGLDWDRAVRREVVPAGTTRTQFGAWYNGTISYFVRAVTKQGLYSENAAVATLTMIAQSPYVEEADEDLSGAGFPGTLDGLDTASGGLQLIELPTPASAWTDAASSYTQPAWQTHYTTGTYTTNAIEAQDDAGAGIVADEVLMLEVATTAPVIGAPTARQWGAPITPADSVGTVSQGVSGFTEIDTTLDDPAGTPTWDGWRLWQPGTRYRYRGVRMRFTLFSDFFQVLRVGTLVIRRFRKNIKDEGHVTVVASGGTPITFNQPFTKVPVVVTAESSNSSWDSGVRDVTRTGAIVRVFDKNGNEQSSGEVDFIAAGV
jgi:hypothetical protein